MSKEPIVEELTSKLARHGDPEFNELLHLLVLSDGMNERLATQLKEARDIIGDVAPILDEYLREEQTRGGAWDVAIRARRDRADELRKRAKELQVQGLSHAQIATKLGRSKRRVATYLSAKNR